MNLTVFISSLDVLILRLFLSSIHLAIVRGNVNPREVLL
jgi:hypothetical protein